MARYTEHQRGQLDQTVHRWKSQCLLGDEPLVFADFPGLWSVDRLQELHRLFNDNPLAGEAAGGRFFTKLDEQLSTASVEVRLLTAEAMLVHLLFSSAMTTAGKRRTIERTMQDSGVSLPASVDAALGEGIGDPGMRFNLRRDLQLGYFIEFVLRLKQQPLDERIELLENPWQLRDFADDTRWSTNEMRHILLHLLCPDEFERISSGAHKRQIAKAFAGFLDTDAPVDVDERLFAIRQRLQSFLPDGNTHDGRSSIDFYHQPLHAVWGTTSSGSSDGVADIETLLWKKQLVLYGPPGTSKTWQAGKLAETLIRQEAMKRWGAKQFFTHAQALDKAVEDNVFRLQLHPGIGYEQFIRGLRLEGNVTRYRPGYLPWVVTQLEAQHHPDGLASLPGVLILDEINRTNVSEMLGEAFSLLERDQRGKPVQLPGFDEGQQPDVLVIPEDLYVIATMNEIDHSVESLDFALRRRFLWRECPFDRDALIEIISSRWSQDITARFGLDEAAIEQVHMLADRAEALNAEIENSAELGRHYQIGHTYFADITFFVGTWTEGRRNRPPNGTYLWNSRGNPQPPLTDLWQRSLEPLLHQYLAGSDLRTDEISRFAEAFLGRP
ncbi:AAA family ATPase [Nocardia sp. NPDC058176]|uniref:AAA family ATPase n=1 Tax=Nocardia sp. NPDC058176 TaxID=3346368 RepID=UPI0036DC4EF2